MEPNIEVTESKLFAGMVADEIVASINDALHEVGRCSLVLAGGKTPSVIYRTLSKPPRVGEVDWQRVRIFWGDERWVPKDDLQSNFKMVNETLLSVLPQPGPEVYAVNTALGSAQEGASQYSKTIAHALDIAPGGLPIFDLVLLGVGDEGHTASIFPHSPILTPQYLDPAQTPPICAAVPGPSQEGWRVTMVPAALFSARKIIFIVRGDNKAGIIKRTIEGNEDIQDLPARLGWQAKGRVAWFLDSAAAQQLIKR
jgi:6-phosphogluconolactonase